MEVLKVAKTSSPRAVAGALAEIIRKEGAAEVRAIGSGAVNQAVKAEIIAKGFLKPGGIEVKVEPSFFDTEIEGEERTGIKLEVTKV